MITRWSRRTSRTCSSSSGDRDPAAADQAEGPRGARGLEHFVVRTDHDAGGVEHRQHLGDPARHLAASSVSKMRRRLLRGADRSTSHRSPRAEDQADDQRDGGGPDRVHEIDSRGVDSSLDGQLIRAPARGRSASVWHLFTVSFIPSTTGCRAGAYGGCALLLVARADHDQTDGTYIDARLLPGAARRHPGRPGADGPGRLLGGSHVHHRAARSRHPPGRAGDHRGREARRQAGRDREPGVLAAGPSGTGRR